MTPAGTEACPPQSRNPLSRCPRMSRSQTRESTVLNGRHEPATTFATRADTKGVEGISKSKLILLGGGLAVAVLFFVFTALVGKSPKKPTQVRQPSQQANQELMKPPKGSVTPVMDTVRTPAPDNSNGQLGPGDIRRTRSLNDQAHFKPVAAKPSAATSLGSVPSFRGYAAEMGRSSAIRRTSC